MFASFSSMNFDVKKYLSLPCSTKQDNHAIDLFNEHGPGVLVQDEGDDDDVGLVTLKPVYG